MSGKAGSDPGVTAALGAAGFSPGCCVHEETVPEGAAVESRRFDPPRSVAERPSPQRLLFVLSIPDRQRSLRDVRDGRQRPPGGQGVLAKELTSLTEAGCDISLEL